ncbi:S-layer homology domain-containing protein [Halalkalibacterium ligniniphilum]|uniref:S-layer homology domain-containing protein n=1 Tax=Halalkalibacterium ligniniphilum TaxID=1134413 RepID=UPI00034573D9|nr:S-layer homology domain-containing protein [Halalkalibacterium ligniniphilum]
MKKRSLKVRAAMLTAVMVMAAPFVEGAPAKVEASGTVQSQFQVATGVDYRELRVSSNVTANVLNVNLNDPYTKLDVHTPLPFNSTMTTTQQARANSSEGHRVVGAVNATFFDMQSPDRMPFSIIAENNRIINYGVVSTDRNHYRSEPIVFGVKRDGKATVDTYEIRSRASFNGESLPVHNMNYTRNNNELIIYTPSHIRERTGTNQYGVEVVVRNASKNMSQLSFGDRVTGTVERVYSYNESGNSAIPKDGFVLSGNGATNIDKLSKLKPGDSVEVTIDINDTWKDAQLILGSGPQLVKNGRVDITMNTSSFRATQRVARTGVAVNRTGDRVFMVTASAMTIPEFAQYMVSLGADRALNFDGGGSTTMAVRQQGQMYPTLANSPSDGSERRVSATLQAISTAPSGTLASVEFEAISRPVVVGSRVTIKPTRAFDLHYQTMPFDQSQVDWAVTAGIGTLNGLQFEATKAGQGRVRALKDGNVLGSVPITVIDTFDRLDVEPAKTTFNFGETQTFTAKAANNQGAQPIFNASQVKWSVSGNIGTINQKGEFRAGNQSASGHVIASFNNVERRIPVSVISPDQFRDVPADHWAFEQLHFLKDRGVLRGYEDGTVGASQQLRRAQAASMLVREFKLRENNATYPDPGFSDISTDFYAYHDIAAIAGAGFMTGRDNGSFGPNGTLTRGQMAVILYRAYGLEGQATSGGQRFPDVSPDFWAYKEIEALVAAGIASGYENGNFGPNDPVSRAQFAVFLHRAITHQ